MKTQLLPTIFLPFPVTLIASEHGPTLPVSPTPTSLVPFFVDSIPFTGCLSDHELSTYYVPGLLKAGDLETQTLSSVAYTWKQTATPCDDAVTEGSPERCEHTAEELLTHGDEGRLPGGGVI